MITNNEFLLTPQGAFRYGTLEKHFPRRIFSAEGTSQLLEFSRHKKDKKKKSFQRIYKITLRSGVFSIVSEDQPLRLHDGSSKSVLDLEKGNVVASIPSLEFDTYPLDFWTQTVSGKVTQERHRAELKRFPNNWSSDLAYLMGYVWGDGYIADKRAATGWHHALRMITVNGRKGEKATRILRQLSPNKVSVSQVSENGVNEVSTDSVSLVRWLQCLGFPTSDQPKLIPRSVWCAPYDAKVAFLAGWYDSDGGRGDFNVFKATLTSTSVDRMIQGFVLLRSLGVPVLLKGRPRHNTFTFGEREYTYDVTEWTLSMSRADLTMKPLLTGLSHVMDDWTPDRQRAPRVDKINYHEITSIDYVGQQEVAGLPSTFLTPLGIYDAELGN